MFDNDEPWHNKKLLIDADIIAYQMATKYETPFGNDLSEAKAGVDAFVARLKGRLKSTKEIMCLSGGHNFRKDVIKSYKHNRKPKPAMLSALREYISNNFETRMRPTLEADDVMGILSTKFPNSYIICTIDKDLYQIPGWHFNWNGHGKKKLMSMINPKSKWNPTGQKEIKAKTKFSVDPFHVGEFEAKRLFYVQTLTGDSVDNFVGIPGIAEKKAWCILNEALEAYDAVAAEDYDDILTEALVKAYEANDLSIKFLCQQANCARILHNTDWDSENNQVILWKPSEFNPQNL